jgi:hypothetical protein
MTDSTRRPPSSGVLWRPWRARSFAGCTTREAVSADARPSASASGLGPGDCFAGICRAASTRACRRSGSAAWRRAERLSEAGETRRGSTRHCPTQAALRLVARKAAASARRSDPVLCTSVSRSAAADLPKDGRRPPLKMVRQREGTAARRRLPGAAPFRIRLSAAVPLLASTRQSRPPVWRSGPPKRSTTTRFMGQLIHRPARPVIRIIRPVSHRYKTVRDCADLDRRPGARRMRETRAGDAARPARQSTDRPEEPLRADSTARRGCARRSDGGSCLT